jgi:glycosyltransferase 2 family protein
MRVAPRRFREQLPRLRESFAQTDATLAQFFRLPFRTLLAPLSVYTSVWLLEALETYALLRLLGADISWQAAFCMEAVLSFLRAVISVLPAGLGVQDLGYMVFLRALGIADANNMAVAFSLLKRCREALWILVGYACLASPVRAGLPAATEQPA